METVKDIDPTHTELAEELARRGGRVRVATVSDVLGRAKSKCVPIAQRGELLAGHERYTPRGLGGLGVMTPDEDECIALPDPATLQILPFDGRFAHMAAYLSYGGREPFALCPRSILKAQVERAEGAGFSMLLGVESELYFVRPTEHGEGGAVPRAGGAPAGYQFPLAPSGSLRPTPAYDVEATLDALPFLVPMVDALDACGFGVFSFYHEGGDGQVEFDFAHAGALETADRMLLFRVIAKQVAKQVGLIATFMPKPYTESWGSGAHFNMSLVDPGSGQNLFRDLEDPRGRGWSKVAYGFVAGILRHAPALAAICTPTVNSYKRLTPRLSDGTVSWAPIYAAYGDNNRSCMLRLPRNRPAVEDRAVDAAANPYLAAAFLLAAGIEGVEQGLDPGDPVEELTYDWSSRSGASAGRGARLPRNLLEAVEALAADPLASEVFPAQFLATYTEMKLDEWEAYHRVVTDWERSTYLTML